MFLAGQLAIAQRVVEHCTGLLPVSVFGPGRGCHTAAEWCAQPFRHGDDRRSHLLFPRRGGADSLGCVSAVPMATYSGQRATAATGGGLRASAALTAGRGVLGPHGCVRGM